MPRLGHRWQLVLFSGAILIPSLVLVAVSQRTIRQNRELAGKRQLDEQRAARERVARDLLAKLENLRAAPGQAVALVARVDAGRLSLPWEDDPAVRRFHELAARPAFAAALARGEQSEFAGRDSDAAARHYREAMAAATHPAQAAYARHLLALALARRGRASEAAVEARRLLKAPPDVVDEEGVPLSVHAAGLLAASAGDRAAVQTALAAALDARPWMSPVAAYAIRNAVERAEQADLRARVEAAIRLQEQAQALQNDAARLRLLDPRQPGQPLWAYYSGAEPWLVGAPVVGASPVVLAARAREAFQPFEAAGIRFLPATEPGGEPLGDSFPSLKVLLPAPPATDVGRESGIYYAALFALLAGTALAAGVLWRSLRREMQLAETRAQFVASVSHELKTPLTSIRMFAETLQMGRPEEPRVRGEYLETIVNESERLARLVDDVLLFSRIEQGAKAWRLRPVDLADIVRAALRALSYPLSQHGFEPRLSLDENLPPVKADPDALEQSVLNLLTNAMKYSGESRRIDVRLWRDNGEAHLAVIDYGVGIAPADHARIFEKYYRVPTRENQSIPGTGLGLTLVAQIVKAHGGRVEVESAPGKGSTFTIRLPLKES